MPVSNIIITYIIYIILTTSLTIYVSKTLFKSGKSFMLEIFKGNQEIALATNKLFEVGFYLLNFGWALLYLKIHVYTTYGGKEMFEVLGYKIGSFSIYLGVMLFLNMYLFFRGRKASRHTISNSKPVVTEHIIIDRKE